MVETLKQLFCFHKYKEHPFILLNGILNENERYVKIGECTVKFCIKCDYPKSIRMNVEN